MPIPIPECEYCSALEGFPHEAFCPHVNRLTPEELSAATHELYLLEVELLTSSLHEFLKVAWPIIEPSRAFIDNWHIGAITEHLEAVDRGEIKRLVINIPPRMLKSITVDVMFPSWVWTHRPQVKFLSVSYNRSLVIRDTNKSRRLIQSSWYQRRWPHVAIHADQNMKSYFENVHSGARIIASFEAGATGEGGDIIIVDDPSELSDAFNASALKHVQDVWDDTLSTRLNDPTTGAFVIMMQRLSSKDLTGYVLRERGWTHLMLPMEYESRRKCVTYLPRDKDPRSGQPLPDRVPFFEDPRTIDGELLFPERADEAVVANLKSKGELIYASQQQQRPVPQGGYVFQEDWFKYYKILPASFDTRADGCISVDCAYKDLKTAAYVCLGAWGRLNTAHYLLHVIRKRMTFPETMIALRSLCDMFPWIGPKLIEDKANGPAVISMMQSELVGLIAVNPEGGKESRANAVSYLFQAGNVLLPDPEAVRWVKDYTSELQSFPRGEFQDQVDMTSQALIWYDKRRAGDTSVDDLLRAGAGVDVQPERVIF